MFKNITSVFIACSFIVSFQSYATFEMPSQYPTDRSFNTPTPDQAQADADKAKKAAEDARADVERLKNTNSYPALKHAEDKAKHLEEFHKKAQELADSLRQKPKPN